jgi:hypothetical protein
LQRYFIVEIAEAEHAKNVNVEVAVQRQLAEYKLTQQEVDSWGRSWLFT